MLQEGSSCTVTEIWSFKYFGVMTWQLACKFFLLQIIYRIVSYRIVSMQFY